MAAERQKETGAWPMLKHNAKGWNNEVVRHQSPPLLGCAALEFAANGKAHRLQGVSLST